MKGLRRGSHRQISASDLLCRVTPRKPAMPCSDSETAAGESKFLRPTFAIGPHSRCMAFRCPLCGPCRGEKPKSREVIGEGIASSIPWRAQPFRAWLPHRTCDRRTCQLQLAYDPGRLSAWRPATFSRTERWHPRPGAPIPLVGVSSVKKSGAVAGISATPSDFRKS
jgi:hypothetical protein